MNGPFLAGLIVSGRKCVVLGHDHEAEDKAARLIAAGARVTLVTSAPGSALLALAERSGVTLHRRDDPGEALAEAFLVVDARRDVEGARVLFECARRPGGFLLCAVDQPDFCTVVNVATVQRGPLQVAISTAGMAPALAGRIRKALEAELPEALGDFVRYLGRARRGLAPSERRAWMARALEHFELRIAVELPDFERPPADSVEPEHPLRST